MKKAFNLILLITAICLSVGLLSACQKHTCNFGEWEIVTYANCTQDGLQKQVCSCGKEKTQAIKASHTLVDINLVQASEHATGIIAHKHCNVCGKNFAIDTMQEISEVIIPAKHTIALVNAVEATCTTDGNIQYYSCSGGKYYSDANWEHEIEKDSWIIPANGHSGEFEYDYANQTYSRYCEKCGDAEIVAAGNEQFPLLVRDKQELIDIVGNAQPNSFIKLSNDIRIETTTDYELVLRIPNNGTLDLGNHTIIVNRNAGFVIEGEKVTLQNGKFETDFANQAEGYALFIGDMGNNNDVSIKNIDTLGGINVFNCKATFYNCNIDATGRTYYALWADNGSTITVESGVYRGGGNCIHSTANSTELEGSGFVVINGGSFYGNIIATYCTTINGGDFYGNVAVSVANKVNGKLIVNKDMVDKLQIVANQHGYELVESEDEDGNKIYETRLIEQTE